MESYLFSDLHDLVSSDWKITSLQRLSKTSVEAVVTIDHISPAFIGYQIDSQLVVFNLKSTLAQLGLNAIGTDYHLDRKLPTATLKVRLQAIRPL